MMMVGGKKRNASKRAFGRAGANTCKQRARDHSSSATLRNARDLASPARGCASTGHHRAPRITPHPPATYPPSYICRRASSLPSTCDRKAKGALSHGAVSMGGGDDGDDGDGLGLKRPRLDVPPIDSSQAPPSVPPIDDSRAPPSVPPVDDSRAPPSIPPAEDSQAPRPRGSSLQRAQPGPSISTSSSSTWTWVYSTSTSSALSSSTS